MDSTTCSELLLNSESSKNDALMFVEGTFWHNSLFSNNSKTSKHILSQVNTKLSNPDTRLEGLLLLTCLLQKSSPQLVSENCLHWAQNLKKIVLHDGKVHTRCVAARILGEVLYSASKSPEQHRHMAANLAPQLISQLLNMDESFDLVVAIVLSSLLKFLPGPCRQQVLGIQKRLIEMLSVKNSELLEVSSTCIALLPFVSGGDRAKTHATAWTELYEKFCRSLHWELNTLYENMEVDQQITSDLTEQIIFPHTLTKEDSASIFLDVYHRTMSICSCLQKMLSTGASSVITVPVESTLNLIGRILKVNGKAAASRSSLDPHAVLLFTFLPKIHKEALTILENLILCCRRHMLLHDQKILSHLLQTLQWTSVIQKNQVENKHALCKLRSVVYQVLITWLSVAGSGSDLSHMGDSLTRQMLKDVFYEEKSTELSKETSSKQSSVKAKKRKLEEPLLQAQKIPSNLVDEETCFLALKALKSVFYNGLEDLRMTTFKDVCSKLISILLKLQQSLAYPSAVPPYGSVKCRTSVYKLLLAIVVTTFGTSHQILSKCIHIFSRGQLDNNPKVTQVCCQGLATCRSIIEPIRRCLAHAEFVPDASAAIDVDSDSDASESQANETTQGLERTVQTLADTSESPCHADPESVNGLESSSLSPRLGIEIEMKVNEHSPPMQCLVSNVEEDDDDVLMLEPEEQSSSGLVIPSNPRTPSPEIVSVISLPKSSSVEPQVKENPHEAECQDESVQDVIDNGGNVGADAILRSFVDSYPDERDEDV